MFPVSYLSPVVHILRNQKNPAFFGLRLHALDNHQFRVSRGLAQRLRLGVFWRTPPLLRALHAGKLGDDQAFARPLSSRTMGPPRATNRPPYFSIEGSTVRL